jgi:hypothetical protein
MRAILAEFAAVPNVQPVEAPSAANSIVDVRPPAEHATPAGAFTAKPELTEVGGPKGPEPTRYGDWERNGRCVDF